MGNSRGLFTILFLIVAILTLCTATALAVISFSEDKSHETITLKTESPQLTFTDTAPNSKTFFIEDTPKEEQEETKATSTSSKSTTSSSSSIAQDEEDEFASEEDEVSNLEDDVEESEDDLDDVTDAISDAEDDNDIEDIEDDLDDLNEDVDDIEDEIDDLKEQLDDENNDDAEYLVERLEDLEDELDELNDDIDAAEDALSTKQQEIEGEDETSDSDSDGVLDTADICSGYDDNVDTDSDGTPDGCDSVDNTDSDGDGVINTNDICSGYDDAIDTDGDGTPDGCDSVDNTDSDSDGILDTADVCEGYNDAIDSDGDGTPDGCDSVDNTDTDGDGVIDTEDVCAGYDDTVDTDSDGTPDGCDNEAPTVTTDCSSTATVGVAYTCTATGIDTDGTISSYTISGVSGMSIDSSSGALSWTPTTSQIGTQTFTVTVTDDDAETGTTSISVTVSGSDIEEFLAAIDSLEDDVDDLTDDISDFSEQITEDLTNEEILSLLEQLYDLEDEVSDLEDNLDDLYDDFEDIDSDDFDDAGIDQDDVEESLDTLVDDIDGLYDTLDDLYYELESFYESYSYELCNEDLYFGVNISSCEGDVTEDEFGLLGAGTYEDTDGTTLNSVTYTQTIALQNEATGQFVFTQDDDDAPDADAYIFIDNSNNYLYNYSLAFDTPVLFDGTSETTAEDDLVGTTLIIQDATYEITELTLSSGMITELTLEAEDGQQIMLRENNEATLDGVDIDGTLSLIDSSEGTLNGFSIAFAPDVDEVYLASGDEYVDPVFGQFSIYYDGIYASFEELLFIAGSTSAELSFYNYDGTYAEILLAADSSYTAGEAADESIFWGAEAPTSTTANQDELLYLEDETCSGSASVVDCQGAMFLVIDSDGNAHVTQIINIDTSADEISFDDITYGTSGEAIVYTDGAVSDISTDIGTIQLFIDETAKTITFTTIGSTDGASIITYNFATLEIVNTDTSTQTYEGIKFSEYNDGLREEEKYLVDLEINAFYDDATDNSIEWDTTAITSLGSDEGFGVYDESDTNDDVQDFVTYKGTLIEFDRLDQSYIYLLHPYEAVYAIVSLETQ